MQLLRIGLVFALCLPLALADPGLFSEIGKKQNVRLITPSGECLAKVVERRSTELRLQLRDTTHSCGQKRKVVTVLRSDVVDVVDRRRRDDSDGSRAARRATMIVVGGFGLASATRSITVSHVFGAGAAAVLVTSAVREGARPRYEVLLGKELVSQN